jgi:hypothetical protein
VNLTWQSRHAVVSKFGFTFMAGKLLMSFVYLWCVLCGFLIGKKMINRIVTMWCKLNQLLGLGDFGLIVWDVSDNLGDADQSMDRIQATTTSQVLAYCNESFMGLGLGLSSSIALINKWVHWGDECVVKVGSC